MAPSSPEQPDPFSANARTYYTPQTMIPVTPPSGAPTRTKRTSKEESIIFSLQTQLALQIDLCGQYETDLRAKDELVEILSKKVSEFEKEESKRRSLLKSWKKKVQELERTCRHLEEEVDGSRWDSMERSVMDETSEQVLRMLHTQIAALEREKKEWKREEEVLRADLTQARETLEGREHQPSTQRIGSWEDEKGELLKQMEGMAAEKKVLNDELLRAAELLAAKAKEHDVLQTELNAQWRHTEKASEKIRELECRAAELLHERDMLQVDLKEIGAKALNTSGLDERRLELEAEIQALWNQKDELDNEKRQIEEDLQAERNQTEELSCSLQERDERISELSQELQFAEAHLQERETELELRSRRFSEGTEELSHLRQEVAQLTQELSDAKSKEARTVGRSSSRESEIRDRLDELSRRHAAAESALNQALDKIGALESELESSKTQISELHKENANKDVKLLQAAKKREEDRADLAGMNMALDAKQQELELIKRKMGVKGTAGSTATTAVSRPRRESSITNTVTPSITTLRPASSLSNVSSTVTKHKPSISDTGSDKLTALGSSTRANRVRSPTNSTSLARRSELGLKTKPAASHPLSSAIRISSLSRTSRSTASLRSPGSDREASPSNQERTMRKATRSSRPSLSSPSGLTTLDREEKENVDVLTRRQASDPMPA